MNEQQEIKEILDEHRAWTWNRFKEQHGAHVIATDREFGDTSHVYAAGAALPICGNGPSIAWTYPEFACWPTCQGCADQIYNLCRTSLPEEVSVQCEVSGDSGQLVLPNSENWGLT